MRQQLNRTQTTTALGVAGVMLVLAIPPIWPYGYYQILRWVVTTVAAFAAYNAYEDERVGWIWVLVGVAILFNPVAPIGLDKSIWILLDLAVAGIFGGYIFASYQD